MDSLGTALGTELVRLSRIRGSLGPVLVSAKLEVKKMEELYQTTGTRSRLYWEIKNLIPHLEKLVHKANLELEQVVQETLDQHREVVTEEYEKARKERIKKRKLQGVS